MARLEEGGGRRALLAGFIGMVLVAGATAQPVGSLERGKYLIEGVAACGNCHFQRGARGEPLPALGLSGGMKFDEVPFTAYAANITPDPATGIGRWTDAQLARAIREGVRPDGSLIGPPMPMANYRQLSDEDLAALVAYLRAQPPVVHAVPRSVYRMPLPPAWGPPVGRVTAPSPTDTLRYGAYLVEVGHCMDCHTPRDDRGQPLADKAGAGGMAFEGPWGRSVARNLTPHANGLKDWSDAQIVRAVRQGVDRSGKPYLPPMGFGFYQNISDADMAAIVAHLRSLAPQP